MPSQETLDAIALKDAESKRQSREFLSEVLIDDYAQKAAIGRVAMATGYAQDPGPYSRPYPGSSVTKQVIQGSGLAGLLGPALATLATAGTVLGGMAYFRPHAAPTAVTQSNDVEVKPIDLKVKWWYEGDQLKSEVTELTPEEAEKLKQEKESQK